MQSRSPYRWPIFCLSALCLTVLAGAAPAQVPDEAFYRDMGQTIEARKLLLDDPQLGGLNLGVRVINRTAILWGPVPSRELAHRAEQRLRSMFELVEVRNQLAVCPDGDSRRRAPEAPQFLPEAQPTLDNPLPLRRLARPEAAVALAGIVTPEETLTLHSSPAPLHAAFSAPPRWTTLHLPFLGSVALPR